MREESWTKFKAIWFYMHNEIKTIERVYLHYKELDVDTYE